MLKKFLKYTGAFLGLLIFIYIINSMSVSKSEYYETSIYPIKWEGVIEHKKIHSDKDHRIITFKTEDTLISLDLTAALNSEKANEIYNAINIGDSIFKDANSGLMRLKIGNEYKEYNLGTHPNPYIHRKSK